MARKTLYGVAAIAVVAIAVFVIRGLPPTEKGSQATIEAANQHRADQIKSEDVVLQNQDIQALVQTDFFHRLVTDKSFQKVVADGSVAALLDRTNNSVSLVQLSRALESKTLVDALASKQLERAEELLKEELDRAAQLKVAAINMHVLDNAAVLDRMQTHQVTQAQELLKEELAKGAELQMVQIDRAVFKNQNVLARVQSNDLEKAKELLSQELAKGAELQMVQIDRAVFKNQNVLDRITGNDVTGAAAMLEKESVARVESDAAALTQLLKSESMSRFIETHGVAGLTTLAQSEFALAASQVGFDKLVSSERFQQDMARGETDKYAVGVDKVER